VFVYGHEIPNSNATYLCLPACPSVDAGPDERIFRDLRLLRLRHSTRVNSGHENAINDSADHDEELDAFTFARFEVCFAATP
jgi:hypothetical protein